MGREPRALESRWEMQGGGRNALGAPPEALQRPHATSYQFNPSSETPEFGDGRGTFFMRDGLRRRSDAAKARLSSGSVGSTIEESLELVRAAVPVPSLHYACTFFCTHSAPLRAGRLRWRGCTVPPSPLHTRCPIPPAQQHMGRLAPPVSGSATPMASKGAESCRGCFFLLRFPACCCMAGEWAAIRTRSSSRA